jgi:hypothetical protein
MIFLRVLSGKQSGKSQTIREIPCVIGRAAAADFRLEDYGIWERHLQLTFGSESELEAKVFPNATALRNGEPFESVGLRNGDILEIGGARIQFLFSETHPKSLKLRETLTWVSLLAITASQIFLIVWLSR